MEYSLLLSDVLRKCPDDWPFGEYISVSSWSCLYVWGIIKSMESFGIWTCVKHHFQNCIIWMKDATIHRDLEIVSSQNSGNGGRSMLPSRIPGWILVTSEMHLCLVPR